MTVSFRIKDDFGSRLEELSKKTQRTKSFYLNEALERYLEDLEDYYIAVNTLEEIKSGKQSTTALEEVMKRYK